MFCNNSSNSMPSSSSNHKQQQQHKGTTNQPVVQAIVDSLTRCFSPIVGSDEYGTGRCPSTTTSTANNTRRRDGNSSSKSRRSSTTSTTADQHKPNNNNNNNKGTYDADRYIHRKLEIFRTTDEECLAEFGIPHPRPMKRHKSSSPNSKKEKEKESKEEKGGSNNHRRNQSANTLVYSSEDQSEEIDNITTVQLREKQRQRQQQASSNPSTSNNNTSSGGSNNLANILNILRNPFNCLNELHELQTKNGLCFANPVHDSEDYDNLNMGDWNISDEEFKKFKEEEGMIPDVDESSASLDGGDDEEQTMTSASYFDQKYSHIKITNPPMLLYTEHRVKYEEYDDHIFQIVERRKRGYNVHTTTIASSTASNGRWRGSSPTTSNIVLKKNSKLLESKFKARRDKRIKNGINKGGCNKRNNDENVVPLAKSSSVSADSVTDPMLAAAVC